MTARSSTLDELPWLTPSPRKRRKARLKAYGRGGLVVAALAVPQLATVDFAALGLFGGKQAAARPPAGTTAKFGVIEAPFAPKSLRPLSTQQAVAWNAKVPDAALAINPASSVSIIGAAGTSFSRSLECLTAAVYYEAANEPSGGQRAVAQVVLNRMRHPEYPHTVCGVVFQGSERRTGCQFSFTCDGSLARVPSQDGWRRAQGVAAAALAGAVYAPVGWSTHYHADYVVPYWAQSLQKLTTIGHHIFYRWNGSSGEGASFTSRYAGAEPEVGGFKMPEALALDGLLEPTGGVTHVAEVDRPIITAGAAEAAPASGTTAKPAVPAPSAATAATGPAAPAAQSEDRWIIGVPRPK